MAFVVLVVGILFIITAIVAFKLHPFLALILAAILVGLISPRALQYEELKAQIEVALKAEPDFATLTEQQKEERRLELAWEIQNVETALAAEPDIASLSAAEKDERRVQLRQDGKGSYSQWLLALKLTAQGFGKTAAGIAIVIVLAAVIGQCLLESGAADKITRTLLRILGEGLASVALLASGYALSVPVFFDTVFFLLVPLARALRLRTGRNYVLYVIAICAGGAITHSLVPPTPGPLVMVENLPGLELAEAIYLGFLIGIPPAVIGALVYGVIINRKLNIPLREVSGMSNEELEEIVRRPDDALPGFFFSVLPVLLPVVLITGQSVIKTLLDGEPGSLDSSTRGFLLAVRPYTAFLGDKNVALLLATLIAALVLLKQRGLTLVQLKEKLEPAFASAGVIILITSAGGAFGSMLRRIGLGEALGELAGGADQGLVYLLLAWGVAAVMKTAQGSGTVSMITTAGIMASLLAGGVELPYHMIYIFSAIGFGSLCLSWMNDSGFWVVCKLGGFTERETLATWSVLLAIMAILGLGEVLLLSHYWPLID